MFFKTKVSDDIFRGDPMSKFIYLLRCIFGFGNKLYILLTIFGGLILLGMFQNCSPVAFKQITEIAGNVELVSTAPSCGSTPAPASRETLACPLGAVGLGGVRSREISCSESSWITTAWSEIDYSSCVCSGGRVINPTSGLCECNGGKEFIGGLCTVSACNATLKPPESDTALCPSGFGNASRSRTVSCSAPNWNAGAWSGYDYSKCTCAYAGQTLNPTTGSCACPTGQTVVGGSCQPMPSMTCSLGTKPPDSQTLTCPGGSLGSYTRTTSVTCVSGAWVTGASVNNYNSCSCPATGQIFDPLKSPACSCPTTAPILSGSACVTAVDATCLGTPPDKNQDVRCPGPESTGTVVNARTVTCNTSTKTWVAGLFPEPNFSTCRCPYSKQSSDSKGICTCPTGMYPIQASLSCGVCLTGQTYDPVSKSCISTGGTAGCAAAEVKWGETNGCNAIVADSAANQILAVTSRTFTGNAQFKCNASTKTLEYVSGTCKASCTVASEYKSAWQNSACMGIMPIGVYSHEKTFRIQADPSLSASSAAAGVTSTNSYIDMKCYDGKLIEMDAVCRYSTAAGAKCAGGSIRWDSSGLNDAGTCTANVAETESGYALTVGNTFKDYQGNFTGYCVNGKWEGVNSLVGCTKLSGVPQNCKGTYTSPVGSSCKFSYTAPVEGVPSGWSQYLNNTATGYLGSSKLVCADGNWWQGPITDCAPVDSTVKCPRIDLCADLATLSDVPIKACFQQDPIFAGGAAIVTSWNQPDCQAHVNCDTDGQWSYTKVGGKLDLSGTCKIPTTPIPPDTVVKCAAGSAPIESTPNSSGKTNTCTFTWPEGTVGQTKVPTSTNGGTGSLTCQSTGKWSYSYSCPPPGDAVVCAGGSTTIMSSPNSVGEKNSCIFSWAQGNVGQTIKPTGTNGGTGSLTCGATGVWSYSYVCPAPGNPVVCAGGSQSITSLKSSDGKTNTCVFTWDQGTAGQTIKPTGTNGGTGSLTCGATGAWSYSYNCPTPDKAVTCLGGSTEMASATVAGKTCILSWPLSPVSTTTVKGTGTNGGAISGVCTSTGEWKSVVATCP